MRLCSIGWREVSIPGVFLPLSIKKTANPVDSEPGIVILICSALNSAPNARDDFASGKRETWRGIVLPAGVAQLVEQLICNQQVDGSSPPASSGKMCGGVGLPSRISKWTDRQVSPAVRAGSEVVKRNRL